MVIRKYSFPDSINGGQEKDLAHPTKNNIHKEKVTTFENLTSPRRLSENSKIKLLEK